MTKSDLRPTCSGIIVFCFVKVSGCKAISQGGSSVSYKITTSAKSAANVELSSIIGSAALYMLWVASLQVLRNPFVGPSGPQAVVSNRQKEFR